MKVTQEKLPASQVGLEIEVPAEASKAAYEQVIKEFSRTAKLPGFRKGKIPRHVLIQQLGSQNLKAAAVEKLIKQSVDEAIAQEQLDTLGSPQLKSEFDSLVNQFKPGEAIAFKAAVDVPPEPTLAEYKGLSVKAEEIKPDPEAVNEVLKSEQEKRVTLIPIEDRPCQLGDVAVVDFVGRRVAKDGEEVPEPAEIPGASATDFQVEMESDRFIPGFIDGIVGMEQGQTKTIAVKFPDEYPQEDIAGQPAEFEITLKEIKEKELPELDDEFAEEVSEFETLEALTTSLTERFAKEAEDKTKSNKQQALVKALLEKVEVELPESLIEDTVTQQLTQMAMQLSNQGMDMNKVFTPEQIPRFRQNARPEAIKAIRESLAIAEIAKQQSLQADESEIQAKMDDVLKTVEDPKEINRDRLKEIVTEDLNREKVLEWLEANGTVELVAEGSLNSEETSPEIENPETQPEAESSEINAPS
ncbi:trigger factor [Roseofilum sp. Belize BBD 4]|uniref:trigger factor n=1 Tax=unclassified Roseofilum TaxID=2620099 RepID=UPI001B16697C|nr:trigger factor [Roseofilum sp. Belize Diploria]MBP0032438.1 trigger factor [Roseofilum sp. Belize BBD 4]